MTITNRDKTAVMTIFRAWQRRDQLGIQAQRELYKTCLRNFVTNPVKTQTQTREDKADHAGWLIYTHLVMAVFSSKEENPEQLTLQFRLTIRSQMPKAATISPTICRWVTAWSKQPLRVWKASQSHCLFELGNQSINQVVGVLREETQLLPTQLLPTKASDPDPTGESSTTEKSPSATVQAMITNPPDSSRSAAAKARDRQAVVFAPCLLIEVPSLKLRKWSLWSRLTWMFLPQCAHYHQPRLLYHR